MDATLRPYTPADFETLHQIDQICYPTGIAYSKRELRWYLSRPRAECLVACAGDVRATAADSAKREGHGSAQEITGFVLAEHEGPLAHIITIDVLPAYRRRGTGAALLSALEARLAEQGVRRVELETATDNAAAVAFWEKHGYRTLKVLRRYYLNRVDAFFMAKHLGPS